MNAREAGALWVDRRRWWDWGMNWLMYLMVAKSVQRKELNSKAFVVAGMRYVGETRDERFAVGYSSC